MSSGWLDPRHVLRGRRTECDVLDRLLASVRDGQSQVLVVRGEAGVGKSTLLDYLADNASGCEVARASGNEYEMELPYAGLHQLCAPALGLLERLPAPQRDALASAFGLRAEPAPDRFVVGLGVLSLLSEVAEKQPIVWVLDDAQWLDEASALSLAFVARRLLAESVGLVFSVREPGDVRELAGLPELVVGGLSDGDARAVLDSALPGRLDEQVRDRIVAESRGNPLALLELPHGLRPAELAGGFELPLPNTIEQSFLRRLEALPPETRRLLLTAAAEPVGDVTLLWRAAGELGLPADAAQPAQAAGLIELGARVRFRHPLVRSAVYQSASVFERQEVHRALADATDADADPDRRAWHRAHAASGLDETVADELERSAGRAQARGGVAAAAAFLERSVELTPDRVDRGRRALDAAQAKFESGALEAAQALLAVAEACPLDELQSARVTRLRAQIAFALRRGSDAPPLLLEAAEQLEPLDGEAGREAYLEAVGAAIFVGRLNPLVGEEVAAAARHALPAPQPRRGTDLLLEGLATRYAHGYGAGVAPLRAALEAFGHDGTVDQDELVRWFWLPWLVAGDLWDDDSWHDLATRAVERCRESGALVALPLALGYRAAVHLHAGEFAAATALTEEAESLTAATGNAPVKYPALLLAAWRGVDTEATLDEFSRALENATTRGEGRGIGAVAYTTAVFYNGLGAYEAALASARSACAYDDLGIFGFALLELVEAGVRSGAGDEAATALRQLEERTTAAETDWALGVRASSRALLSAGETAELLYREAIERLARSRIAVRLARAHLLYGEWLRRENRRVDAREHLRAAHELFSGMGAEAFAERSSRELLASGETARKRSDDARAELTPQEAQIARLARDGLSNPEIGAQLFISPRTVQYHLHKVFLKLEISSRNQLGRVPAGNLGSA
jgi:DNA-binding CsgD family transcriptional regulator